MVKLKKKKLQYNIHGEAAKMSALSSRKINIFQFFRGEEILPHDQRGVTEQPKFAYLLQKKLSKNKRKQLKNKGLKGSGTEAIKNKNEMKDFFKKKREIMNSKIK